MIWRALLIALMLGATCFADSKVIETKPGATHIAVPVPAGANVSWLAREPIDLEFFTLDLADGSKAIVLNGNDGQQFIVVSDAIWLNDDGKSIGRELTTWIVKFGNVDDGGDVDPNPPDPGPGPKPPEPDPLPDNIPNKYGIGPAIAPSLVGKDKSQVSAVVPGFVNAERLLNSSANTAKPVLDQIYGELSAKGWGDVASALRTAVNKAGEQYGFGVTPAKNYIREARLTIELFK